MKCNKLVKLGVLSFLLATPLSQAALMTLTFDNGSNDATDGWVTDRSDPASFSISGNELVMSVDGGNYSGVAGTFQDTKGKQLDITGSNFVSVDMYIDSDNWTTAERFAGMWGVGRDGVNDISNYPILEYQGAGSVFADAGVTVYDSWVPGGWVDVAAIFNANAFNNLAMQVANNGIQYFVNGIMVYSETTSGTTSFSAVILNAKNDGTSFDVRYDNLTYGTVDVSEPAMLALFGLGAFALVARRRSKKLAC